MKRIPLSLLAAVGMVSVAASIAAAQAPAPPGREGRGGGAPGGRFGGRGPVSPVLQALDTDGDGELSAKEIENATTALKTLDKDKDGKLAGEELRPTIANRGPGSASGIAQQMVTQFMTFDKNGDGKLSKEELPERMQVLLDRADANKDGFVDRAELTTIAEQAVRRTPNEGTPGPGGGGEPKRRTRPQTPSTDA